MLGEAIVSKLMQKFGNLTTVAMRLTPGLGSLAVAQIEGEGDEASRGGIRFHIGASGATGIAPVQALPTTAAQWLLYNPPGSGVNVFIDRIGVWLASGTAGAGGTLLIAPVTSANVPATEPQTSVTGVVLQNASMGSRRGSALVVVSGQTLANAPSWAPAAWMNPAGTVLGQTQMIAEDVRGKWMLPPDTGLALAVISPTGTTPLFVPCGSYREYQGDFE